VINTTHAKTTPKIPLAVSFSFPRIPPISQAIPKSKPAISPQQTIPITIFPKKELPVTSLGSFPNVIVFFCSF